MGHRPRGRGSKTSRTASPKKLTENTNTPMAIMDGTGNQGWVSMNFLPNWSMPPQLGMSGEIPTPKKLSAASATMAKPRLMVNSTM